MRTERPEQWGEMITSVLNDAEKRLGCSIAGADICVWTQTWGDTALGFGGMAGQTITTAPTVVVWQMCRGKDPLVYHGGRFAYSVPAARHKFEDACANQHLPGAIDYGAIKGLSEPETPQGDN